MNDAIQIRAVMPCANGCVRKGTEQDDQPLLMGALHGHFCDRCYWRAHYALRRTGNLVGHMITLIGGIQSKGSDGSQKLKGNPPLPLNAEAFNDANETYSRLVYWASLWATRINVQAPGPAARAWRADNNRIVGLPADISSQAAQYATGVMAAWLNIHLEQISATTNTDDVAYFFTEMTEIFRLDAKWPQEDRAEYAPVVCPDDECKGQIAIHPPRFAGDDEKIVCEQCHREFDRDGYDHMASVFRQVRAEQAKEFVKAARTQARLARKYGT